MAWALRHTTMTSNSPTALSSLARRPGSAFLTLLKKAEQIHAVNLTLSAELDSSLAPHCRAVNLRGSMLVLAVDSPAWATRLRFQTSELLSVLRQRGWPGLASVELIILHPDKDLRPPGKAPTPPVDARPPEKTRRQIAAVLAQDADGLPPELARRLRKLADSYTKTI